MKTNKILLSGIAAGFAFMSTQAIAGGSIGGDCCADLEERVAELEATAVRKGNRKVSLKLSGFVSKNIYFADGADLGFSDGDNDDVEVRDHLNAGSRFRLTGKAKISSDLYSGYAIEFGLGSGVNSDSSYNGIIGELRRNELYIGSKTLGKISIGKGSTASEGIAEIDLSGTSYFGGNSLEVYDGLDNVDGFGRQERVRYDTPSIAGFKLSASWQENDNTDIALRFASNFGDFKLAAGIAAFNTEATDTTGIAGSASLFHVPTGLSLSIAAADNDAGYDYIFYQAGIKQKVFAAGATALSVGYFDADGDVPVFEGDAYGSRLQIGLNQQIDAAAMSLFAKVNHYDDLDRTDFYIGSMINF